MIGKIFDSTVKKGQVVNDINLVIHTFISKSYECDSQYNLSEKINVNVQCGCLALVTIFYVLYLGRKYQKARCIYQVWKHPAKVIKISEGHVSKRLYSFNYRQNANNILTILYSFTFQLINLSSKYPF